ncbi:MAG: HlyD family efflux transporter periplasmic adaptor subunit [Candidatus Zixiibacteriota bacterium]
MDREIPPEIIRKRRIRLILKITVILLVMAGGVWALREVISPTLDARKIKTFIAEIGPVEATLSASGVVVPEYEQAITSPINSTIEKVYHRSGDSVKAGEVILEINKDLSRMALKQLNDELEMLQNNKEQLRLELERKLIDLQASYEISNLQAQFIKTQYDRVRHLFDIGAETQENLQRADLNVKIALEEVQQWEKQIENQKAFLEAELKGLNLQISIQENKMDEVQREIGLSDVRPSHDGVITMISDNIGSSVNRGDILVRVADLGSYRIDANISDIHADKVQNGGAVKIRIGEKQLTGRIGSIRPAVKDGVITFLVELDDKADRILRPNIRCDVYVVTSSKNHVVRVKNGPFYTGHVDQEVFVVKGDVAVRKMAKIGVSNFDYVEIESEIEPGDEVIISSMDKFRHMSEVQIKNN